MTFNPSSTIYLCNVPIDNTYKNQIYFAKLADQNKYFSSRVVKTFSNYLTVRKTLADGSFQSSIKVDANIDDLYQCNYMYYQNANHGTRYFYAFITKLIYVNEGTTEIVFETDVYQTWRFFTELKESYVVREHSETDNVGDNVVPEKFNFEDYKYITIESASKAENLSEYGYLIATSEFVPFEVTDYEGKGGFYSGVYQGHYMYYVSDFTGVSSFLETAETVSDCVQSITVIPKFCVSNSFADDVLNVGMLAKTSDPANEVIDIYIREFLEENEEGKKLFDGYEYKNNKLRTSPFFNFVVSNQNGDEAIYNIEDFAVSNYITFTMYGDISSNPSITLIPSNYKGVKKNVDFGISISNFPQCSFNSDTYKLWLAKNQFGQTIDIVRSVGNIVAGVATMAVSGGASAMFSHALTVSGVNGILNTINNTYQASKLPNGTKSGSLKNNLLTAMDENRFHFYLRYIKRDYAETVDNFFTMFGYQTNKLKVPNVSSRPYFNYVQTVDVNIIGAIPDDDMVRLKAMYNNGVTLWKPNATVGDYSVDNSPA